MKQEYQTLFDKVVQRYCDYMDWLGDYPSDTADKIKGVLFNNKNAYIAPILHYTLYCEYIENYSLHIRNCQDDNIKYAILGALREDIIHSIRVLLDRSAILFSLWYKYKDFTDSKNGFGTYNCEQNSGTGLVGYAYSKVNDEIYNETNIHDVDFLKYITWEYEDCFKNLSKFDNNIKHNRSHSVDISFEKLGEMKELPNNFDLYPQKFISYNKNGKINAIIESTDLGDLIEHIYLYIDSIVKGMLF